MNEQECNLCAEGFDWNSDTTACVKVASSAGAAAVEP